LLKKIKKDLKRQIKIKIKNKLLLIKQIKIYGKRNDIQKGNKEAEKKQEEIKLPIKIRLRHSRKGEF